MSDTSSYVDFFLNSKSSVVQLELLEITHPSFSKIYRVVRNNPLGVRVRHEDGVFYDYEYYPLKIEQDGDFANLDQGFKITIGDLGEEVPDQLDLVRQADTFKTKPTMKYRSYRSDDLLNVMLGPAIMEIKSFSMASEGATFTAIAPQLNLSATGEIYTLNRFDALRGTI